MSKKNIVIIGGGYAGVSVINSMEGLLPSTHRIVLVEQQDFMYLRLAAARASASEDIAERVLVPYDKLFKSPETGVVVNASVSSVNPHSVTLSEPHETFGTEIDFDYLVIYLNVYALKIDYCHRKLLE
jgi:NADH:ubiquinone reductase (H+-translocating)